MANLAVPVTDESDNGRQRAHTKAATATRTRSMVRRGGRSRLGVVVLVGDDLVDEVRVGEVLGDIRYLAIDV